MWKALKKSKWYWFIPIIGMIFLNRMSHWVFKDTTAHEQGYRMIIVLSTVPIHAFTMIFIALYFHILPVE